MTEKDLEIQELRKIIARKNKDIADLTRLIESLCIKLKICAICEHLDSDSCVPKHSTCFPELGRRFIPKS